MHVLRTNRGPRLNADDATEASLLALLDRIAAEPPGGRSVDDAMRTGVEGICRLTGSAVGRVRYVVPTRQAGVVASDVWHLADPDRFASFRDAVRRTPATRAVGPTADEATLPHAAWVVDLAADAGSPRGRIRHAVGLRSAFAFTIPVAGRRFAVVECLSTARVPVDRRSLDVASHVGRQLGRLIESMRSEDALRESESRFRSVAQSATDAIVAADGNGDIIYWNRGAERIFGYVEADVVGRPLSILMPERFRPMHDAGLRRVVQGGPDASRLVGQTVEVVGLRKDGRELPIELALATWEAPEGRFFSGIIRDISERKKAEGRIRALLETAPDPIVEIDGAGSVVLANARTARVFGYDDRTEIVGRSVEALFAERSRAQMLERLADARRAAAAEPSSTGFAIEAWGIRSDGSEFPVDVTLSALPSDDRGILITGIIRDTTERKRFEARLKHLADHDALTELYNRRRFEEELDSYLERAARYGEEGALILLDVDKFKRVNDTHGHKAGDEVIRSVASALRDCVRDTDTVARLGGDEFAILLRHAGRSEAEEAAQRIVDSVRDRRMPIEGRRVTTTTSVGVALLGNGRASVEDALVKSDLAMYAAKNAGGDRWSMFDADGSEQPAGMPADPLTVHQIRRGLDDDRLVLHCQPISDVRSDSVTQYELLLRLKGDDGSLIPAATSIAVAERFDMIREIDRWVASRAIELGPASPPTT